MKITYINEMTGEEVVEYIEVEQVEMEGITNEQMADYANYREMLDAQIASGGRNQKNWLDISYLATTLQIHLYDNAEKYKRVYEAWKNQDMKFIEVQPKRFFVVTGIEWEYGYTLEEVQSGIYNLEEDEVGLNNPLDNGFAPNVYKLSDVTEISKEAYNKIMQLHYDSAEEGWGEEEEQKLQVLIEEALSIEEPIDGMISERPYMAIKEMQLSEVEPFNNGSQVVSIVSRKHLERFKKALGFMGAEIYSVYHCPEGFQVHHDKVEEPIEEMIEKRLEQKDTWAEFENEETGCKVTARTFTIDGEKRTVVLDNFSDYPFSIQNFDLGAFEVEEDWSNIYENPHVELVHGQHEILEKYLSPEDWKLVVMQLEWEYGIEVSTWDYDNQVPMQRTMTKLARVKLFERYNDLLMKSLKEGLNDEENTEYYMLYDELSLKEGENIYNLMKEMYEIRGGNNEKVANNG